MKIEDADPLMLPSIPLNERSALPDIPAVYFAIGHDDVVLYVGKARRLLVRWRGTAHHRYTQLSTIGDVRLAWLPIDDDRMLQVIEALYIARIDPVLNRSKVLREKGQSAPLHAPHQLYEAIKALAKKDLRSINAEIIILLQEAVARRKQPPAE
jgi:hypothetical protein